ncbi:MAG: DUF5131 family protein [Caulobacter sp.]
MGETTGISWADMTFNPWIGCMKVSPACDGCYAEALMETRMGRAVWGAPGKGVGTRVRTSEANWRKPLAWNRKAAKDGTRPFVFCASLADVFDNAVPPEWRRDLFDLIRATPHLTWLLLTKRPGNIDKLFVEAMRLGEDADDFNEFVGGNWSALWPRNAAIGCTVVTQDEADRDIPRLLSAKAALDPAFAFVSMEPLIGPVDLTAHLWGRAKPCSDCSLDADCGCGFFPRGAVPDEPSLDWVITGGETDQGSHKARPAHPDWFRTIRDQCAAAGVAYHHKQNGEWVGFNDHIPPNTNPREARHDLGTTPVFRVGKAMAGRWLDGQIHDARPSVPAPVVEKEVG